jgi:hypothetical protein
MEKTLNSYITLRDEVTQIKFIWEKFDEDDCFDEHKIIVVRKGKNEVFDFGPCVVWGIKKVVIFLNNRNEMKTGSGFRNPDIMYYYIYREGNALRLEIQIQSKEDEIFNFILNNPIVELDLPIIDYFNDDL